MKEIEDFIADVLSFVGELEQLRKSLLKLHVDSSDVVRLQANDMERAASEFIVDFQSRVLRLIYLALNSTSTQDCGEESDLELNMIGY